MNAEYWVCIIGPAERQRLPDGCDFPMRQGVQEAFERLVGEWASVCYSGWGTSEDRKNRLLNAWNGSEAVPEVRDERA